MNMNNKESMDLLRETLAMYVKDLAEELFYWMEELNKLDATGAAGASPEHSAPQLGLTRQLG